MKQDDHYSEEQLNALVDGELDPEEKSRFYNETERSPDLDQRLCHQRKLKELVKHAYENVPTPLRANRTPLGRGGFFGRMLAAVILLVVGLTAGFLAHNYLNQFGADSNGPATVDTADVSEFFILHVTSGAPERMQAALRHASALLDGAEQGGQRRVEIIVNERGIDLLRADVTPYSQEIAVLQANDVVFYACSKTIERLENRGVRVQLVPHTNTEYTALDRVVSRMQDGWTYERI